jgi:thymidylate synthase
MLTHIINNAHIYENHFDAMKEQLNRYNKLNHSVYNYDTFKDFHKDTTHEDYNDLQELFSTNPKLILNSNIKDFYDFTIDDIILEYYKHMGKLQMEVSV